MRFGVLLSNDSAMRNWIGLTEKIDIGWSAVYRLATKTVKSNSICIPIINVLHSSELPTQWALSPLPTRLSKSGSYQNLIQILSKSGSYHS